MATISEEKAKLDAHALLEEGASSGGAPFSKEECEALLAYIEDAKDNSYESGQYMERLCQ